MCNEKQAWDTELSDLLQRKKWKKWEVSSPERGCAAFICRLPRAPSEGRVAQLWRCQQVRQLSGMTQCLVDAKARLAKQGLTIPRLELVAAHMATNLVTKVKNVLEGLPIENIRVA